MSEAEFQVQYNIWKQYNYKVTCAEELKVCKGKLFELSKIAPHQLLNLTNAKHNWFQYKIPDLGAQNPFDSFSLYKVPAYVVILWYKPRKHKVFYMIDIDIINDLISVGGKSFSEEVAEKIADKIGILK